MPGTASAPTPSTRSPGRVIAEADWLAREPVYYDASTGHVSRDVHELIRDRAWRFDPEGLRNYLEFGFSVFGQTPFENVRFLLPCQRALRDESGALRIEDRPDPATFDASFEMDEATLLETLRQRVATWAASRSGVIVIPTSGGYDSRLLNLWVERREQVRAFTYGISTDQPRSREVLRAREVCRRLDVTWDRIELGRYHERMPDWYDLVGPVVHAHGMYQIEFYHAVRDRLAPEDMARACVLSGIIGDVWAGTVHVPPIDDPGDLIQASYAHGLAADPTACRLPVREDRRRQFFERYRDHLADPRGRVVVAMRLKLMLLRYLLEVPASLGFDVWTPFLEPDVAMAMLMLPPDRRRGRAWQRQALAAAGFEPLIGRFAGDASFGLDHVAARLVPLEPLDAEALSEAIRPDYVEHVNREVLEPSRWSRWRRRAGDRPLLGAALGRIGAPDPWLRAYAAYMTLWPLQEAIIRRGGFDPSAAPP
ncbi:MAG: hypothetical protein CMJ18_27440 [Phycisphaeraceae bacterium]|nr:hypothetical protein [Phycisphaeraceae bacterium]